MGKEKIDNYDDFDYDADFARDYDQEYDDYMDELIRLETNNPHLVRPDSPTLKVGTEVISEFKKVVHSTPMLSLGDVFNYEEVMEFDERIKKTISNPKYVCEHKIDGLSVSLIYEKGKLINPKILLINLENNMIVKNMNDTPNSSQKYNSYFKIIEQRIKCYNPDIILIGKN